MAVSDKIVGLLFLGISLFVFSYYTIWVFITPFFEHHYITEEFFPPREWAIIVPIILIIIGITAVASFISYVLITDKRKKKQN